MGGWEALVRVVRAHRQHRNTNPRYDTKSKIEEQDKRHHRGHWDRLRRLRATPALRSSFGNFPTFSIKSK